MSLGAVDRLFALRRTPPFDRVGLAELAAIAARMDERVHAPHAPLLAAGRPVEDLLVVVAGGAERATPPAAGTGPLRPAGPAPAVLGLAGLLFGTRPTTDVVAGPDGATTLSLAREHLFTVLQACPELLAGVLAAADGEAYR